MRTGNTAGNIPAHGLADNHFSVYQMTLLKCCLGCTSSFPVVFSRPQVISLTRRCHRPARCPGFRGSSAMPTTPASGARRPASLQVSSATSTTPCESGLKAAEASASIQPFHKNPASYMSSLSSSQSATNRTVISYF